MSGVLTLPGLGPATHCTAYNDHRPRPLRFVWHHLLPETCGGASDLTNVVQVCDSCHYAIHDLLWVLKTSAGDPKVWGRYGADQQRAYALRGWQLAAKVGMTDRIPNEGGILPQLLEAA